MDLETVRRLKKRLVPELDLREVATVRSLPEDPVAMSTSALPKLQPGPTIGVGIEGTGGNYRLSVSVYEVASGLETKLDRLRDEADGELSVHLVGKVAKQQWYRQSQRPLLIGSSIGHPSVTAGTLGAVVQDASTGEPLLLSNNHIFADENRAAINDSIWQPARSDLQGAPPETVARLHRYEPLRQGVSNRIDAAVARLVPDVRADPDTLTGLGNLAGVRSTPIESDEPVFKIGRTTGQTEGRIRAFEVDDVVVEFDLGNLIFEGLLEIVPVGSRPFSLGGDSGSLIVDSDLRAVGLLFAGNDVDTTYACPIQPILETLRVRF